MNLILQDEVPVYERPRRLRVQEKAEVTNQIETSLNGGEYEGLHAIPTTAEFMKSWLDLKDEEEGDIENEKENSSGNDAASEDRCN
ncbi:hypothetical protein KM043_016099 [Ampulex compressa]|nr:hypothetical protein KM043_016099 [Ampulex compressa]